MKNSPNHRLIPAIVFLVGTTIGIAGSAAAQSSTVRLANNHPSAETMATVEATSSLASSTNLSMRVVLALRNQSDLTQLLQDLQDPSSSEYHRWLTPEEFTARFGPTPEDIAQVSSWLSQQGFKVTSANASNRTIGFTGSAAQAAAAFKVTFAATCRARPSHRASRR
jgi:subtilase family serine protease